VIDLSWAIAVKAASNEVTLSPLVDGDPEAPGAAEDGASDGAVEAGGSVGAAVGDGVAAVPLQAETTIERDARTGRETIRALKGGLL
jgi:hypothetical protein